MARGRWRVLGVFLAGLQWYQCGFYFFLTARWWLAAKGAAFAIVLLTLAISQSLTFSMAIFYFWRTDFVPFQGCSLPFLILPGASDHGWVEQSHRTGSGEDAIHKNPERETDEAGDEQHQGPNLEEGLRVSSSGSLNRSGLHRSVDVENQTLPSVLEADESTPLVSSTETAEKPDKGLSWRYNAVPERRGLLESTVEKKLLDSDVDRRRFIEVHGQTCFWAHGLLAVGFTIVTGLIVIDFGWERFFDGEHIRHFLVGTNNAVVVTYYIAMIVIYWGMYSVVVVCCLFFCITRSMIAAILEAEKTTILPSVTLQEAFFRQDRLMEHIRRLTKNISLWFFVHNVSFFVLILASVYWWLDTNRSLRDHHHAQLYVSVITLCLAIAYKFAFPVWSAGRVTYYWKRQMMVLNRSRRWSPGRLADQDMLLNSLSRSQSGFIVCGIQVTDSWFLFIFMFIGSFLGLVHTVHSLKQYPSPTLKPEFALS